MNEVIWLNQGFSFWDQTLLKDILTESERQIFVVPGAINEVDEVNMEMEHYNKVLVIVTSDEENKFPVDQLFHEDMKVFVSYPNLEKHQHVDGYLPIGYTPRTRELIKKYGNKPKDLDFFFAGQINHRDRQECFEALKDVPGGHLIGTTGFSQGLDYEEYMEYMCRSKVVPCPAGSVSPDSFRLYEALEAGCVPIVTNRPFWEMLFGEEPPFPIMNSWETLPDFIENTRDRYPAFNNECQAWWIKKKRDLKCMLN